MGVFHIIINHNTGLGPLHKKNKQKLQILSSFIVSLIN